MDIQSLTALAEEKIQTNSGALSDFRRTHLHLLKEQGFKTKDPEQYKFTSLLKFLTPFIYSPSSIKTVDLKSYEDDAFYNLFFVNGQLQTEKVSSKDFSADLTVSLLKDKFNEVQDLFKTSENALTHLHHSLLQEGVVIEVKKNKSIDRPLRIVHLNTQNVVSAPTIVIKALVGSSLTLIEENIGQTSYLHVGETHLHLEPTAHVEHVQLELGCEGSLHHGSTFAEVAKDASYKNVVFHLSGSLNRRNLDLKLKDTGANGESYNLYLTDHAEHSDLNTVIQHEAADTTSNQMAKGILSGESKGIFTGKIHIHQHAQRVASGQINKNLLLSKKAQAHSQPQLEIFADDVKCSHGSTTGQLSDEELFYFEARGIPRDKARTLLAHGFGLEIVLKIKNKEVREKIANLVLKTLDSKFKIGSTL